MMRHPGHMAAHRIRSHHRASPLSWTTVVVSHDVTDAAVMAACLGDGIEGDCVQLEARSFIGRVTTVHLRAAVVQFSHEDVASVRHIRTPCNRWVFFVPLVAPRGVRWNGQPIAADMMIIGGPDAESVVFEPGGSEFAVVSVAPEAAPEVIAATRAALGAPSMQGIIHVAPAAACALVQELVHVRSTVELRTERTASDLIHDADATIRRRLCACLRTGVVSRYADDSRSHIVRRTEQLLRDHADEAISISNLSSMAGVSERSLRNAFYRVCTTSPKRYLRMLRLHQVRRSLSAATQARATVTRVATQHGFYELGRFAGEYRALFGETPSETLQRARIGSLRAASRPAVPSA